MKPRGGLSRRGPLRNLKCTLEYEGTRFHGWQRQTRHLSIQQSLEETIERLTGSAVRVVGAGRTDSGVHARGQVAHFKTRSLLDPWTLRRGINALGPPDVRVVSIEEVDLGFHARYDTRSKRYLYRLYTGDVPPVFDVRITHHVPGPLDVHGMREAARHLEGRHDFRPFCRKMEPSRTTTRTLYSLDIWEEKEYIFIAMEADGFLYTMARSIVGTLLQVGAGKRNPREVGAIFCSNHRSRAGPPAPSRGLFLMEVRYTSRAPDGSPARSR